jgi:hypothetical protein
MATSPTEEPVMDTRHEEPRNLADELLLDSFAAVRATMLSGFPPLTGPVKCCGAAARSG